VDQLGENDRVAVVVYASDCGVRLPPTSGANKQAILSAIDGLEAGGSTNAGSGIQLAYQQAAASLIPGGSNRIILCTDGDFNVGITDRGELVRLVESKAKAGVALTILGVGFGNLKDATLEQLADRGHGNYAYLDTLAEARKVLVEQMAGTLITIAKDVKVQVEFNPARVTAYRLIGYENRLLRAEDFKDDKKTGGDIGSGHTVTALYEVVPVGKKINLSHVDPLKYQPPARPSDAAKGGELLTVKLRYKDPSGHVSKPVELPVTDAGGALASASEDFRFAAAVAEFGLLLRDSEFRADASFASVLELARAGRGQDPHGYRGEFMKLVQKAQELRGQ
jgi:Ca-activated chloride channel family protein